MTSRPDNEIIHIIVTHADIAILADELGVDFDLAFARAENWGRHVEATAAALVNAQLSSIIERNEP